MSLFDCGRCGATFANNEAFEDHRIQMHGIQSKRYPEVPAGSHEKNLNGRVHAASIRRDARRGNNVGGDRSVD